MPEHGDVRQVSTGFEVFLNGSWVPFEFLDPPDGFDALNIDPQTNRLIARPPDGQWVDIDETGPTDEGIPPRPPWWPEFVPWPPMTQETSVSVPGEPNILGEPTTTRRVVPPQFDTNTFLSMQRAFAPDPEEQSRIVTAPNGETFIQSPGGALTKLTAPPDLADSELGRIEQERLATESAQAFDLQRQQLAQQAVPKSVEAMLAPRMAALIDRGDYAGASRLFDITRQPSPDTMLELAMQFADRGDALRVLYDFIRGRGIPGLLDPEAVVNQQIAQVDPGQVAQATPEVQNQFGALTRSQGFQWNSQTKAWERTAQTALARLREIDPASAATLQNQLDPGAFTETPPVADIPFATTPQESVTRARQQREAGAAAFEAEAEGIGGVPFAAPSADPRRIPGGTLQPRPERFAGERVALEQAVTEGGLLAPTPAFALAGGREFAPPAAPPSRTGRVTLDVGGAEPRFATPEAARAEATRVAFAAPELASPTTQPGAGQTRLVQTSTGEIRIINTADVPFALAQPQFVGFQVNAEGPPAPPAPAFATPAGQQGRPAPTFPEFVAATRELAKPRRDFDRRVPFGRPRFAA